MTPTQAINFEHEIGRLCDKEGVWLTVSRDLKPDLKMIRMEISIKVEQEK